ncbi:epoxide hydrolase N-terminal domain-containing protein [Amycolatopsis sp. MEPSY49]|uniref:epoxide hydrolase N-terminal domain-containing protein n=1 Tax=Amycolatopsis sp. MEPSY49 TaxID=3151600 RepID=UPI003EF9DF56
MTTLEQRTSHAIRPFTVSFRKGALDDLHHRLAATRWPRRELVGDRSQGVQLATIRALVRYWANGYDLGRVQSRLNALPQFTTEIDGVSIHFIHVKSKHADALPLIMTHGSPGSVIEMIDSIGDAGPVPGLGRSAGPLTEPAAGPRRTCSTTSPPPATKDSCNQSLPLTV